jgi:hypothetical protein
VLAALALVTPRHVAADPGIQTVFDTVDSVEIKNHDLCGGCTTQAVVNIRGIRAGQSVPGDFSFNFGGNTDMATRCERLAVIAMSKPGKFQFGIGADTVITAGHGDCKLILVNP